jgi:hypothetical protein
MKKYLEEMDSRIQGINKLAAETIVEFDRLSDIYADITWTLFNENLTAEEKLEKIKEICGVDDD